MIDYSTIDTHKLKMLPVWKNPGTYQLQREPGNGCALDPPGYPTYFTRSVYTRFGNNPRKGAQMVITFQGVHYVVEHSKDWDGMKDWDEMRNRIQTRLKSLYIPLPLEHPRVQAWISQLFTHFKHCYYHPTIKDGRAKKTVIFPTPYYDLKTFHDDPRFSEEWRIKERASIEQANKEIIEERTKIATIDNHAAVQHVREVYPEYVPDTQTLEHPRREGNWYEREDRKPLPSECPGQYGNKHPVNGSWCQYCGWEGDKDGTKD